jgi:hypothetical protein
MGQKRPIDILDMVKVLIRLGKKGCREAADLEPMLYG